MKKNHFYFLLFFLAFNLLFSQRQLAWSDTVNSAGNFSEYFGGTDGNMIELDAHKNVYSAIMSDSLGLKRVLISKHDSMGNDLWTTIFHSSPGANDWLSAIALDDSGNVLIGGAAGISIGQSKLMVVKFNCSTGQLIWSYFSSSVYYAFAANDIKFDEFGNIYACANYANPSTNSYWYSVLKFNSNGNLLNSFSFNGNTGNYGYPNHMAVDTLGNVYVTAQYKNFISNSDDGALIKLDQNLNQIWIQTYDGPQGGNDYFYDLELDKNQCPIIAGCERQGPIGSTVLTIKYSPTGNIIFSDNFSVPNAIRGTGRSITSDVFGNVYTAAETDSSGLFGFSILKYDTAGNLKNHAKITPPTCLYSAAIDIVVGPKQQAIMFGHFSDGSISSGVIIELDSSGVLKWLHQTSGYETAYNSGVVDDDNNLYVCGSIKTGSANDLLVQKFEPLITLGLSSVSTAGELSVFPNPVSGFVKVKSSDTIHKIIIYDATMKVVFERDFGNEKNIDLDMHQLPCGFYFLKVNGHMEKIIKN